MHKETRRPSVEEQQKLSVTDILDNQTLHDWLVTLHEHFGDFQRMNVPFKLNKEQHEPTLSGTIMVHALDMKVRVDTSPKLLISISIQGGDMFAPDDTVVETLTEFTSLQDLFAFLYNLNLSAVAGEERYLSTVIKKLKQTNTT